MPNHVQSIIAAQGRQNIRVEEKKEILTKLDFFMILILTVYENLTKNIFYIDSTSYIIARIYFRKSF